MSILICMAATVSAVARDVYVIGMEGEVPSDLFCHIKAWRGDIELFNATSAPQRVRALAVSNGALNPPGGYEEIVVPSRGTASMQRVVGSSWYPRTPTPHGPLWMWRLSVPDGVSLQSQMQLVEINFPCATALPSVVTGQITLPIFMSTVPANQEQVFLGSDLGETNRRVNVAVYNAGQTEANVEMTVHRACDGAVLTRAQLVVQPNTTIQQGSLQSGPPQESGCAPSSPARGTYTRVVADQPSIAFVSALSNEDVTRLTHNFIPPSNP